MRPNRALRLLTGLVAVVAATMSVPRAVCGRDALALARGEADAVAPLARAVAASVEQGVETGAFHTGSARFDGEWAYGTVVMSVLGLSQVALSAPSADAHARAIDIGVRRLLSPDLRAFGAAAWGVDGLAELGPGGRGHAYLGYAALALSMARLRDPTMSGAAAHDALMECLASRLDASPHGVFETYPGESYPPDVAMVIGALALHERATGRTHRRVVRRAVERLVAGYVDASSGMLWQAADATSGAPRDAPRASGTALAAYALAFADAGVARRLTAALAQQTDSWLGFGAVREYGSAQGRGDIDSGPVLFGVSVSGTGFSLASARMVHDESRFVALYRTTHLFGVPVVRGDTRRFMTGGPLGNAILLAMMTAGPGSLLGDTRGGGP